MKNYTPKAREVRKAFATDELGNYHPHRAEQFDRFLQDERARVWQKGWDTGFRDLQAAKVVDGYLEIDPSPNPHRPTSADSSNGDDRG